VQEWGKSKQYNSHGNGMRKSLLRNKNKKSKDENKTNESYDS